ncbi:hypothetical protein [Bifidobacterium polysaccharolyticum]|uniref:Lipoprotein n=1 Tax=Bifidobacterium polysaccharolyticum TaxID=2750967 RepID=A0ABS0QVE1_9BIFI|nr:hypothetical protein [Bifidobacterium polysaccharolyticum]MBI0105721.1 hypothetical protein [Bifidobacterium polysaccharolyticum]
MMRVHKLMKNVVLLAVMLSMTLLCGCVGQKSTQNQAQEKSSVERSGSLAQEKSNAERIESLESIFKSEASRKDLDDFERDVLNRAVKTGRIDPADYEAAHDKYLECMANAGYDEHDTKMPDGLYKSSETMDPNIDSKQWFKQSVTCSDHTTGIIEGLFRDQQDNPERYKDPGILAAQCLMDAGIVDKTYTAAKFNESAQILQAHNDNDQRTLQEIFGFSVAGKQGSQARYCLSLGGAGMAIDDGVDNP